MSNQEKNKSPFPIDILELDNIKLKAVNLAYKVSKKYNIIGIIAVEMFLTSEDELLVNEVAPRPHNSYHFSIEGSYTSQFEQFLRTILDLPLGSTKILENSVMLNLVGDSDSKGKFLLERYVSAHSIIISFEGIPAVYFNSLFGKSNDEAKYCLLYTSDAADE